MEKTKTFEDILAWQKAHEFVLTTYSLTKSFPKDEIFGLTSQFRRAAVSIPANIAEGYKRTGLKDKLRFFNIAQGSLEECRYYLKLSLDLGYSKQIVNEKILLENTSRLLNAYCKTISRKL